MEEFQDVLRGIYRFILFIIVITGFLTWSFLTHFFVRDPDKRLLRFSKNVHFFSSVMLKGLNLKLEVVNKPSDDQKFLLISNHMGFVDIMALATCLPMLFVTSTEMRDTPFLGLLTDLGGCIYVERRSRTKILDELKSIVQPLQKGFRVVLYPEATSTNGEQVLPFKKTLMMAAAQAGVPIQPVVINFPEINGEAFSLKNRDHVCWYGDITFIQSMWKTLTIKSVTAHVEFLEQVVTDPDEDRGVVAAKIHKMISDKFNPAKGAPIAAEPPVELEADPT